jgi:hypothetical protein
MINAASFANNLLKLMEEDNQSGSITENEIISKFNFAQMHIDRMNALYFEINTSNASELPFLKSMDIK